jgi:AcrR family transcriptional regulator
MTDDVGRVLPQGTGTPVTIPGPIFAAAVHTFVAGQRLDMRSLARRIGVARATLYRRAGNREQLLDHVLWWRARRLLADQVRASPPDRDGPAHRGNRRRAARHRDRPAGADVPGLRPGNRVARVPTWRGQT